MNPFGGPINPGSSAPAPSGSPTAAPVLPGLDPVAAESGKAKLPKPFNEPPAKGAAKIAQIETLEKLFLPIAAAAGVLYQPDSFIGKKLLTFLTGFKVGEAAETMNKVTPGAALFLLPEPIGALPERFSQKKPQIPGTDVYLDPLYNYTKYQERKEQRQRDEAGAAQLAALEKVLPTLTPEQLALTLNDPELRKKYLTFIPPQTVDVVLIRELQARRAALQLSPLTTEQLRARDLAGERALLAEVVETALAGELVLAPDNRLFAPLFLGLAFAAVNQELPLFGAPPGDASLSPQNIEPTNDAARRNQAKATGINRELVHERADP